MHKMLFIITLIGVKLEEGQCLDSFLKANNITFYPNLNDIFKYFLDNKSCSQLFSDGSQFSFDVTTRLFKSDSLATIIINPFNKIQDCKNVIAVKETLVPSELPLDNIPLFYGHQVLLLVEKIIIDSDRLLLKENAGALLFKDADGILYTASSDSMLARIQPKEYLEEIKSLTGKFKKETIKNFLGRPLHVATFNCTVFSLIKQADGTPSLILGAEAQLLLEITKYYNLTWIIHVPPEDHKWGKLSENGTFDGGVLKLLYEKKADVAFCGLWVDSSIWEMGMDMSIDVGWECQKFIVPRPQPIRTGWQNIFKPFHFDVWLCIITFLLVSMGFLYAFSWITYEWFQQHSEFLKLTSCIFEPVTIFVLAASHKKVFGAVRLLIFVFILLSFLLNTCYSSGLFAQLAKPHYSEKMDTVKQLVTNDYYWTSAAIPNSTFKFNKEDEFDLAWSKRYFKLGSPQEVYGLYKKGMRIALVGQHLGNGMNVDDEFSNEFLENFESSSVCYRFKTVAFGYREGSPYVKIFNTIIRRFHEAGIIEKLIDLSLMYRAQYKPHVYKLLIFEKSEYGEPISLAMNNVIGVFNLLIVGLMVSLIVFFWEVIYTYFF